MSGTEEYGIQPIPPRYDGYNSFYIHTSEGYNKAVEEIEAEERDIAEEKKISDSQLSLDFDENVRLETINRENEKRILEEINQKEEVIEQQTADISEYIFHEEILPGTNVDLLA